MHPVYVWPDALPSAEQLHLFLQQHPHPKHLVFPVAGTQQPPQHLPSVLRHLSGIHWTGTNYLPQLFNADTDAWLLPQPQMHRLAEHFGNAPLHWPQQPAWPQHTAEPTRPWLIPPPPRLTTRVLVIGAGLAGAATAYELARRGVAVSVFEAADTPATAASGNYQGLLYAKISPHHTSQTELLLAGYGYTRRLLESLLPEQQGWGASGVLHLNHNAAEEQRNLALAGQHHHRHLYFPVDPQQATQLTGIPINQSGLYWPQGVWLHPPALVSALLDHPNIQLHLRTPLEQAHFSDNQWHIRAGGQDCSGSHIVFCTGADSSRQPLLQDFPLHAIRGQTSLVAAAGSLNLKTALSGAAYISPAWQGIHCYGATFIPNDTGHDWRDNDEAANRRSLIELNPVLAALLPDNPPSGSLKGHAAVRCDSFDHLPVVGALGDAAVMRQVYAKLAHDKNYRLNDPCPYLPAAYINTAHGSRGIATIPICAAQLAAEICGKALPLSARLRQSLHPNRLPIRQIIRSGNHTPPLKL